MSRTKLIVFSTALAFVATMTSSDALAGANSYVGTKTHSGPSVSMDRIDHSPWDGLLRKYVDENGLVNYRDWHASSADQQQLSGYLSTLSTASRKLPASPDAKKAFWINAYNAVTVSGILREYPTSSIRNHTAKLLGYNIWKDYQLYVDGQPYALEDMEHKILRPMSDPRVHFAIVCASIGCPRLLNEAYVPQRLEEQLETNARDFFSRSQNFKCDANGNFELSSILDWYGEDFGSDRKAQLRRMAPWLPTAETRQAAEQGNVSVSFQDYDWNLNEKK